LIKDNRTIHKLPVESKKTLMTLVVGGLTFAILMTIVALVNILVENKSDYSNTFNTIMICIVGLVTIFPFSYIAAKVICQPQQTLFNSIMNDFPEEILYIAHTGRSMGTSIWSSYKSPGYLIIISDKVIFKGSWKEKDGFEMDISDITVSSSGLGIMGVIIKNNKTLYRLSSWRAKTIISRINAIKLS